MKFSTNIPEKGIVLLLLTVITCCWLDSVKAQSCLVPEFSFEIGYDGLSVDFTDESFGDNPITTRYWTFGDGGFDPNNQNPSHIYSEAGCYTVRLTITDNTGASNYKEKQVCPLGDGAMFVEINAVPWTAGTGQEIEITATVIGGVPPYTFAWEFDTGNSNLGITEPGPHLVTYSSEGNYEVDVTVTDAFGNEAFPNDRFDITIVNADPANFTWGPDDPPIVGLKTTFSADWDVFHYWSPVFSWDFDPNSTEDDITNSILSTADYTFEEDVPYTVTMTICNNNGNGDCQSVQKTITPIELIPEIRAATGVLLNEPPATIGSPLDLRVRLAEDVPISCGYVHWYYELINTDHPYANDILDDQNCNLSYPDRRWTTITPDPIQYWGCYDLKVNCYFVECNNSPPSCGSDSEKTFKCVETVLPPDEIEVVDIELHSGNGCNNYLKAVATGGASAAWPLNYGPCNGSDDNYKFHRWKAFDINEPSKEIDIFKNNTDPSALDHRGCVGLDMEADYFNQVSLGESVLFLVEVEVVDWMDFKGTYKKIISIAPININIGLEHTRCPGSQGQITLTDFVIGGNGNLTYAWSGDDVSDISSTSEQNPLINFPNTPGEDREYTLTVSDDGGCDKSFTFFVTLNSLSLDLPPSIDACIGGSTQELGPGTEYIGGSGNYMVQWESSNPANFGTSLLEDPTALNTIVTGVSSPLNIQYTLTVEDVYDLNGTCTQTDNIWVNGVTFDNFVADAGPDRTRAAGDPVCYGEEITIGTPPNGADYSFLWTSDHPDFEESTLAEPTLTEELNKKPGSYNYHLQVSHTPTGCFKEDDVNVEVLKMWMFEGYEPAIEFAIQGGDAILWDENVVNGVLPNSVNSNSGAELDFSYSWVENPSPGTVNPTLNTYNIPSIGTFKPNVDQYYLTLEVEDEYACKKRFKSNRVALLEREPKLEIVMVSPNSTVVCTGEEMVFSIVMETNFNGSNPAILPKVIELDFSVNHFGGPSNGSNIGLFTTLTGSVKLYLSDIKNGIYSGLLHFTQQLDPANISDIEYSYIEFSGNLGNGMTVMGTQYFQVGYSESILGSKTICDNPTVAAMELSVNPNNSCNSLNIFIGNSPFSGYKWIGGDPGFVLIDGFTTTTGSSDKFLHAYIDRCMYETLLPDDEIEIRVSNEYPEEEGDMDQLSLSVSPNPFTNVVLISYNISKDMDAAEVTLLITSMNGKLIKTLKDRVEHNTGTYAEKFNGSHLPSGSYLVQLQINNKIVTTTLVK